MSIRRESKIRKTKDAKGHNISEHWCYLFLHNEIAWSKDDPHAIMSDQEITLSMHSAFPGRRDSSIFSNVAKVRNRYNRGALHAQRGLRPEKQSYAYKRLWPNGPVARITARGRILEQKGGG